MLCSRQGPTSERQYTWRGQGETRKGISREREVSLFLFILTDSNYRPAWCWTPKIQRQGCPLAHYHHSNYNGCQP